MERIREGATEAFQNRLDGAVEGSAQRRAGGSAKAGAGGGDSGGPQRYRRGAGAAEDSLGAAGALLDAGGEVGKKLDFLLQEMNRETNTILSKTNGVGETGLRITELALAAKADIEKIREQSLKSGMTTVFIISAPSGSGKSTLVHELMRRVPGLRFSVSYTTRPPRGQERNGKDYFFISREEFEARVARGRVSGMGGGIRQLLRDPSSRAGAGRGGGRAIWCSTSMSRVRDN